MPGPRLPPEISHCIVDLLCEEPKVLKQCCLVSKLWVPRTRKYLFGRIEFERSAGVDAWKGAFPDPANSPAHHTCSLSFTCVEKVITAADAEEGSWTRAFSRVIRLAVLNDDVHLSHSKFLILIHSLPILEDPNLGFRGIESGGSSAAVQPPALPPLTGTLVVYLPGGMGRTTRGLLDLQIRNRFRRLDCTLWWEEDFRWTTTLIEESSDTLEYVYIEDLTRDSGLKLSREASTDLSKAKKPQEAVFHPEELNTSWVAMTLKTITSEHRDLQKVLIHCFGISDYGDGQTNARTTIGDESHGDWIDLDRTLMQVWESLAVCTEISYFSRGKRKRARNFMEHLFPETTKRGIVKLVDHSYRH